MRYLSLYTSYHIVFPFGESTRTRPLRSLGIGGGELEGFTGKNAVSLIKSFVQLAESTIAGLEGYDNSIYLRYKVDVAALRRASKCMTQL